MPLKKTSRMGVRNLAFSDNGAYGFDIGTDVAELLKKCKSIAGDFRIRIGMMNPMLMESIKGGFEHD